MQEVLSYDQADLRIKVIDSRTSSARPMNGFGNDVLRPETGITSLDHFQVFDKDTRGNERDAAYGHTAPHEFGHSLGLMSPGQEMVNYNIYVLYTKGIFIGKKSRHKAPYVYIG